MTGKTVLISDLKVEIGPRKILDLELVTDRAAIDRSPDLRQALQTNRLRLVKYSVLKTNKPVIQERVVEKYVENPNAINKQDLAEIIKTVIQEERNNIDDRISKIVGGNLREIASDIRQEIRTGLNNVQIESGSANKALVIEPEIDPAKLAEMQQKSIDKLSQNIEMNESKKPKSIRLINKGVSDLAEEL